MPAARSRLLPRRCWPRRSLGGPPHGHQDRAGVAAGQHYQVDPLLIGHRVELVFDPFDLTVLHVRVRGVPAGTAIPHRIGRHAHLKARPETPPDPPAATGIDYARLVGDAHHAELAQGVNYAAAILAAWRPAWTGTGQRPGTDARRTTRSVIRAGYSGLQLWAGTVGFLADNRRVCRVQCNRTRRR